MLAPSLACTGHPMCDWTLNSMHWKMNSTNATQLVPVILASNLNTDLEDIKVECSIAITTTMQHLGTVNFTSCFAQKNCQQFYVPLPPH